jgi:hypothetical protein
LQKQSLLDEVSKEIKITLRDVQLENFFNDLKQSISQKILDGFTINEIASENDLLTKFIKNTNRKIADVETIDIAIINAAFSQNKDFITDVIDYDSEKSFIINVNEIYPSKVEKIDSVFEKVKLDFIRSKKLLHFENIYKNNNSKNSLENINSEYGIKIEKINVSLNSKNLPKTLTNNIFNAEVDSIIFSSDENNTYFAKVKKVNIPSEIAFSKDINLISDLKNAFGNEIIKTKKISYNDELINGLLSQYK